MADAYSVDLSALRHDAARFTEWAGELTAIAKAAPDLAGVSNAPGVAGVLDAYREAVATLHELAAAEAAECTAFAERLTETARIYAEADEQSAQDVATLSTQLESL